MSGGRRVVVVLGRGRGRNFSAASESGGQCGGRGAPYDRSAAFGHLGGGGGVGRLVVVGVVVVVVGRGGGRNFSAASESGPGGEAGQFGGRGAPYASSAGVGHLGGD